MKDRVVIPPLNRWKAVMRFGQNKYILAQSKPYFSLGTSTLDLAKGRAPKQSGQKFEAKEGKKKKEAH